MSYQSEQHGRSILTGMFIVIGVIGLIFSLFISGDSLPFMNSKIRLATELSQSQGISAGSLVSLNGVTIGNVERIDIAPTDVHKIRATLAIEKRFNGKIPKDSVVELRTQGALGDRYLLITPGVSDEKLNDGQSITAKESQDLLDLISEKGGEAQKIFYLMDEALLLLKAINENQRLNKIMQNSQEASGEAKALLAELRQVVKTWGEGDHKNISESIVKLNSIMEKIDRGQGTLGALINDPSLHIQLKGILGKSASQSEIEALYQKNLQFKSGSN